MKVLVGAWLAVGVLFGIEPRVEWGSASSENGRTCLDLPQGLVDWRALAIASLGVKRFAQPGRDVLQAGVEPETGNSVDVEFQAPVPPVVRARRWTVLYRGGSASITPTVLRGHVVYFVDSTLALTRAPVADGQACADGQTAQAAAFYVTGAAIHDASPYNGSVTALSGDSFAIVVAGETVRFPRPGFALAGVLHVTLFHTEAAEAVALVEWDPGDGSACASSFTLLMLMPRGSRAPLENGYGCDV